MKKLLLVIVVAFSLILSAKSVLAGECKFDPNCDENTCRLMAEDCANQIRMLQSAIKPNEDKMLALEKDINALEANLKALGAQLDKKKVAIANGEQKFATQQKYLDSQVRDYYKKNWTSPLEYFLTTIMSGDNASDTLHLIAYRQNLINRDKATITSLVLQLVDLNKQKKDLEDSQNWLSEKQASLEVTLAPIKKLVAEAKAYQSQLTQTLGALNARQQELIAQKIGSLGLSRSAGIAMACSDDRNIYPKFSPRFAFYTFGIPHRVGMSQFGAYGRANASQDYDKILHAYYNFDGYQTFDQNTNIRVNDGNKINSGNIIWSGGLEDYIRRIYEVPSSWPMDALRAQAIAARSYVLAATNNGRDSICATQDCQVFQTGAKGGQWDQAVNDTEDNGRGKVMVQGGNPIKAWFSSTDGGYTHASSDVPSFGGATSWTKNTRDTNGDIGNISDLFSKAYDRDSPCFYNAQGWRKQYGNSAWLKPEEVADIVNVLMAAQANGGKAPDGIDTWSADQVKSYLTSKGQQSFSRIDSISTDFDFGYGKTTYITLSGDAGTKKYEGKTFKDYFNFRAPANIAIVGPLYNIETR